MTDRTELKRQIAELQAQLAAMPERAEEEVLPCPFCGGKAVWREYDERYPSDAYGLIVDHAQDCFLSFQRSFDIGHKAWGERAALPLAPRAPMDDAAVEALKHLKRWLGEWCELDLSEVIADNGGTAGQYVQHEAKSKIAMIRATLSRVPAAAWPGEAELREIEGDVKVAVSVFAQRHEAISTAVRMTYEALRAHMTRGAQ
jgi:hypothetical protein